MSFLQKLLNYKKICIQCHNNPDPDTVASAFGVQKFLNQNGIESRIVYGGPQGIIKANLKILIKECGIKIEKVEKIEDDEFLVIVDGQKGQGNVYDFGREDCIIIDHHIRVVDENEQYLVKSEYQSCSTIVYELLLEEGYPVKEDEGLCVAMLYGLYTDTSSFLDMFYERDIAMKQELLNDQPLFERLVKSNMSFAELMIVADAMHNHYFDIDRRTAIVEVLKCDQAVLGIIGDFMIQVDSVLLSIVYTEAGDGYQISLRTCHESLRANEIARFLCEGIGSGGGHDKKAGGRVLKGMLKQVYGTQDIFGFINQRLEEYMEKENICFTL